MIDIEKVVTDLNEAIKSFIKELELLVGEFVVDFLEECVDIEKNV